jgi:hypothetical protein
MLTCDLRREGSGRITSAIWQVRVSPITSFDLFDVLVVSGKTSPRNHWRHAASS